MNRAELLRASDSHVPCSANDEIERKLKLSSPVVSSGAFPAAL